MAKVTVEPLFDRPAYAPGDPVRLIALVHGDRPDRVYGGRAELISHVELTARGIRKMRDEPDEDRVWPGHKYHGTVYMQVLAPLADGTPRIWCDLRVPDDARPSGRNDLYSVEWRLRVDAKRKGLDIGDLVPVTVVPRGQEPPPDPRFYAG